MEAGNRCFDQRVPEELNRKVLDHLSDINLVLTEHARRYLIAEGIRPETIIKTGSHMREVLDHYMPNIQKSDVLQRMGLEIGKFFIVSAHREENVDTPQNMLDMVETLNALAEQYDFPVIVSTHPRTQKRLDAMDLGKLNPHIQFLKPFGFCDYVKLQLEALCVLSDSGTISEEGSLLNLPAITIRNAHERPEGMDVGTLIMSGLKKERVLDAVRVIIAQHNRTQRVMKPVQDYDAGTVSKQLLRVVLSYVDYVNRTVWSKPN
jgi:UDP-N-acetylglucosamine 2-epimerase (non-hydrolysing)